MLPDQVFFILVLFVQQTFILRHVLEEEYISTKPFHVMDKWYKFLGGKEKSHAMQYIFFPFLQTPIFSVQSFFIVTNPRRASIQRILETNQLTNDLQNPLYIYISKQSRSEFERNYQSVATEMVSSTWYTLAHYHLLAI